MNATTGKVTKSVTRSEKHYTPTRNTAPSETQRILIFRGWDRIPFKHLDSRWDLKRVEELEEWIKYEEIARDYAEERERDW